MFQDIFVGLGDPALSTTIRSMTSVAKLVLPKNAHGRVPRIALQFDQQRTLT